EALVEPVAAETDVRGILPYRLDPIVGPHHVLAADLERIDPEEPGQFVDRALDRKGCLRCAVAAEAAARHHVGVDGVSDRLLVGAAIGRERAAERSAQRLAA